MHVHGAFLSAPPQENPSCLPPIPQPRPMRRGPRSIVASCRRTGARRPRFRSTSSRRRGGRGSRAMRRPRRCVDYIALGLLASVSAVSGSRTVVDVTPHWREPLVLWLALVGAPSTGKTPAMVAARRLVGGVTAPPDEAREESRRRREADGVAGRSRHLGLVRRGGLARGQCRATRGTAPSWSPPGAATPRTGDGPLEVGRRATRWADRSSGPSRPSGWRRR